MGFSPVSPEGAFGARWRDGADGGVLRLPATGRDIQ